MVTRLRRRREAGAIIRRGSATRRGTLRRIRRSNLEILERSEEVDQEERTTVGSRVEHEITNPVAVEEARRIFGDEPRLRFAERPMAALPARRPI